MIRLMAWWSVWKQNLVVLLRKVVMKFVSSAWLQQISIHYRFAHQANSSQGQRALILSSEKSVGVLVALMYTKTEERNMPMSPAGVATISSS